MGLGLMIRWKGKFLNALSNMSVKAIDTNSLIIPLVNKNPGCQTPLIILSMTPSSISRPNSRFVMCSFKSLIACTFTLTLILWPGDFVIVVVCTRSSVIKEKGKKNVCQRRRSFVRFIFSFYLFFFYFSRFRDENVRKIRYLQRFRVNFPLLRIDEPKNRPENS